MSESLIYELRIALKDIRPPIWRRVALPGSALLADLHDVIQIAMGWTDSHLHGFRWAAPGPRGKLDTQAVQALFRGRRAAEIAALSKPVRCFGPSPDDDPDFGHDMEDETGVALSELLVAPKDHLTYTYDFGDGWVHTVTLQTCYPPKAGVRYPTCLAGKRACPPEDCGGPWGYQHLLTALADPEHPEHTDLAEWVPPDFDPEVFDRREINAILAEAFS